MFLLLSVAAYADNSKISPDLLPLISSNPSTPVNVVVQYSSPPQTCIINLLGGIVCTAVNLLGGVVGVVFDLINAVTGTLTGTEIFNLSNQSNVTYISLDRPVNRTLDYTAAAVNASAAWNTGLDGTGVGIAIIDSGIYNHPDLNDRNLHSRIVYRKSFVGGTLNDDYGHGTHVAGIAAGNGYSSSGPGSFRTLKGMAPNASLLDLRVLDQNGSSNDSVVIQALQQAVHLKSQYNVRVINLSLGRRIWESCTRDPLCQAVEAAWNSGIVVVAAAGNLGRNGYATILSPGNSPHAITVGAMKTMATYSNTDDLIASFSSKGPTYIDLTVKPDLVAPGNQVVSLLAPGSTLVSQAPANVVYSPYYTSSSTSGTPEYLRLSGTSMATPVVTGTVALMLQKTPSLSPDTVKARLMKTASKTFPVASVWIDPATGIAYPDDYDLFTVGAGYLNIAAALSNTDTASKSAASPTASYNSVTAQMTLNNSAGTVWNSSSAWSDSAVWGNSVLLSGTNVIWKGLLVWGSDSIGGTNVVWGDNVVWSDNVVWGDTTKTGEK